MGQMGFGCKSLFLHSPNKPYRKSIAMTAAYAFIR